MTKPLALGRLLLLSTALVAPAALAQTPGTAPTTPSTPSAPASPSTPAATQDETPPDTATATPSPADEAPAEDVEISAPGASDPDEIVVRGRFIPNTIRATPEVISVLSAADIARTGEGDIAGALTRVTGLSVVGNGFVYVRGLGDRYSLALLNGSPLPSPEPLKRVVPLDIFPTSITASAVVQKSFSVNYPGEFGGGVINLTTKAIPDESFLEIGAGISGDVETTGQLGYTYFGSRLDVLGFDTGRRDLPPGLAAAIASGNPVVQGPNFTARQVQDFAASLVNSPTTVLQRNDNIPLNFSADISGGTSWDIGDNQLGLIAAVGFSNGWRTRDARQQSSLDPGLAGTPQSDFRTVITDNRITLNGLLGLGYEFGEHQIRWTNIYIRDTVKQGRLAAGFNRSVDDQQPGEPASIIEQNTYWFERQLIDTQLVGEFEFDDVSLDLRGTYANSQRESPYERSFSYFYDNSIDDYVNNLASGGQTADIAFSDLNEDVYGGAVDVAYKLPTEMSVELSAGYAYTDTQRDASRYQFQYFRPEGALPLAVAQERPDFLVSDFNIYTYNIQLRDVSTAEGAAAYTADLKVHAGYVQAEAELTDGVRAQVGVRYEDAEQSVLPIGTGITPTNLANDYWLPAGTLTFNFAEDMQLRLHGSKTIARPQFRELAPQIYQDFESDRQFTGNPALTDSELINAEARYEWFFDRDQRLTVAGFYKEIDNPIETVAFFAGGGALRTGFANAPKAELYGGEIELQKYFPLDEWFDEPFFANRRLAVIGNYTYTQSELKAGSQTVISPDGAPLAANLLFRDGAPLTGQSDHLANLQIGFEDTERLSQQTLLLTYASERVTTRGPIQGADRQPDFIEKPGFRLDFVARQGFDLGGREVELKFEARNLTGRKYQEFQRSGANRIDVNTYDLGQSFSLSASMKF
jgi:outer membrane receptor protein involved in Fe transport